MVNYSLNKIAKITGGRLEGRTDFNIHQLLIDSRSAAVSSSSLFFAIKGRQHDGHIYVDELYQRGIRAFVVSEMQEHFKTYAGAGFIVVPDTLAALQALAAFHRNQFNIPVIGITGSNGKTIVKEWLFQLMNADRLIVRSPKSYNSQIGVPLSVLEISNDHNLAIFEAGISEPGEMEHLETVIRPTLGVFTNIGHAHDENFHTPQQKAGEKLELFRHSRTLVYCRDYKEIHEEIIKASYLQETNKVTWSRAEAADLFIT